MKIIIPIYIVMMLCTTQVFAQFQFGLGGGLSTATLKHVGFDFNPMYRTGVAFSFPIAYEITPKLTVALIPGLSQKGFSEIYNQNTLHVKTNYMQFIPEVRYSLFHQFYAGVGMYYGIKESEFSKSGTNNWSNSGVFGFYGNEDIGISPSLSYSIGAISISLRYLHGFSNAWQILFTDINGELIPEAKVFNRSFEFAAFYVFSG